MLAQYFHVQRVFEFYKKQACMTYTLLDNTTIVDTYGYISTTNHV